MAGRLYVDFCGEEHVLEPDGGLSFGREADLEIDDNPYLHRVLGRFEHHGDHWWIINAGTTIAINIFDRNSSASAVVSPGSNAALTMADFGIAFLAGRTRYELDAALEEVADPTQGVGAPPDGERTLDWGVVDLNPDQHLLLVGMAEHRLRNPVGRDADPPARAQCARQLGWSLSKYNRKLDHLCAKPTKAGVPGLRGEAGVQASDRRRRLLDHAVQFGLVTVEDLSLLEQCAT